MAWNRKDIKPTEVKQQEIGVGAPVSRNPATAGRAYRDGWSIERAYSEGLQKVTWVARCIDVIAGNQARLPIILRKNNASDGEVINRPDRDVIRLLNEQANIGENAFAFRYRLSSQLLMSSRGVFIEKVRKGNKLVALNLLPPQHTAPIPDPKTFVSGFEVMMPNGQRVVLPPENVLWIRKPHPLDPYLSLTPMESAGIAIEIENLAKMYNRNFLQSDGRPGLLLNVRGDLDIEDRNELESRFTPGAKSGRTTVIGSEDGVDVIDLGSSPRDAAYVQMREITKDEILAAFGVPEPAIGNSSGRTFSNASEEMRVFWMETMIPHLTLLGRSLDALDDEYYTDFDTSKVPVIILLKQERERHLMDEVREGLRSVNEYRAATGVKETDSELADSLLMNPNLTPVANTKKKFVQPAPVDPNAPPAQQAPVDQPLPPEAPPGIVQASLSDAELRVKSALDFDDDKTTLQWSDTFEGFLEEILNNQFSDIESYFSDNARKDLNQDFWKKRWDEKMDSKLKPVIDSVISDAAKRVTVQTRSKEVPQEEIDKATEQQMTRLKKMNDTLILAISSAMEENKDEDSAIAKAAILAAALKIISRRKKTVAEAETQQAWNHGVFLATVGASSSGVAKKKWVTEHDERVRAEHNEIDGKSIPVLSAFKLASGELIRFPGDPLAPPHLTMNCRCKLRFDGSD